MGLKNRIRRHIKDDRPLKLKSYISSHEIDLEDVKFGRGQNALHFCASFGSGDMLRCLLRLECDASSVDKDGNLPLHMALQRALLGDKNEAEDVLSDLVTPLQQAYPLGQDVENRQGTTAHDMLVSLRDKIRKAKQSEQQRKREAERVSREEDERWKRRLEEESLFEYQEEQPRYSADDDDDFSYGGGFQSFDRWSEHIQEEMSRKRKSKQQTFWRDKKAKSQGSTDGASCSRGSNSDQHNEAAEKLRRAREEMRQRYKPAPAKKVTVTRLLVKKQRYEKKFTQLLSNLSGKSLTFGCIPWPHVDFHCISDVLFCDIADKKSEAYRKYLRSQQVRWHPDKFMQKFGEHLHPDHSPKIQARVKALSQLLNKLKSDEAQ